MKQLNCCNAVTPLDVVKARLQAGRRNKRVFTGTLVTTTCVIAFLVSDDTSWLRTRSPVLRAMRECSRFGAVCGHLSG